MANFHKHWYGTLADYTAVATKDSNTLYHCSEGLIYKGSVLLATRRWGDLSGKPSTFAPSAHTHAKSQITDFPTTWAWASLTGVPSTFTPSAHTHDDRYYTETEVNTLLTNKAKWDNAYGWGNHASAGYALNSALTTHTGLTNNPHGVTKSQVGLGNVLNVASYSKTQSDTNLTSAINAIEIGGRNLINNFNSGKWFALRDDFTIDVISDTKVRVYGSAGSANHRYALVVELEPNTEYTLAVNFIEAIGGYYLFREKTDTANDRGNATTLHGADPESSGFGVREGVKEYTFTTQGDTRSIIIEVGSNGSGSFDLTFEYMRLQKGNKATDWTPAPEDVQAEIDLKAPLANPIFTGSVTAPKVITGGYNYAAQTAGVGIGADGLNNGITFYNGTGTTGRIYRNGDVMYFNRGGDTSKGFELSAAGVLTHRNNFTVTGLLTATGNIATANINGAYIKVGSATISWDSANGALRIDKPVYSTSSLAAFGVGSGGGSGGSSYERLDAWSDYTGTKSGWVLSALLGNDLNVRVTNLETSTPNVSWGTPNTYYVPLNINGSTKNLSLNGHVHSQYLTGITASQVTNALGFTPYDSTNPSGYTTNKGTVTSVGLSVPTGLSVSGSPVTVSGTLAIKLASGYAIPTTAKQGQWDTAYAHAGIAGNPHGTTKAQIGLDNVLNVASYSKAESDGKFLPLAGGTLTGNVTAPTFIGALNGNASTATKLSSITTTFTGTYPVTVNVNGTIYSHTGITFTGSTGTLATTNFVGSLTGNATSATKLETARTIAGVSFNGTANIAIPFANLSSKPTTLSGYGITDSVHINNSNWANFRYSVITEADKDIVEDLQGCLKIDGWYNLNIGAEKVYGTRLTINGQKSHDKTQFYLNGSNGSIQYRKSWWNNADWTPLRTMWDTNNLTSLSQLTDNIGVGSHISNTSNPHGVTKSQVGLGSVNNTADSAKNVLSATKLTTARNINGTSFNGSANITTANWGTSRTLTIGSTGKSVNGSANVSWSLAEIGAAVGDNVSYKHDAGSGARWIRIAEFSHYTSYGIISILNSYSNNAPNSVTFYYNSGYRSSTSPSITQIGGRAGIFTKARVVYPTSTNEPGFIEVYYNTTSVGNTLYLRLANSFNCILLRTATIGSVPSTHTSYERSFTDGGISAVAVSANTFYGSLSGNASSATILANARTINGVSFNGSANITITANTPYTLTRGGYLTGSNFNGSANTTWAVDATSANTAGKVVARDSNGDFSCRVVNASSGVYSLKIVTGGHNYTTQTHGVGIGTDGSNSGVIFYDGTGATGRIFRESNVMRFIRGGLSYSGFDINADGSITVQGDMTTRTSLVVGSGNGTYVQIGSARLVYDQTNNAIKVVNANNSSCNLYATGSISAFGIGSSGGSGTSYSRLDDWGDYVDGLTNDYILSAELGHGLYTSVNTLNSFRTGTAWGGSASGYSYLSIDGTIKALSIHGHSHSFASLSSKPTTLSGYGITDAMPLSGGTFLKSTFQILELKRNAAAGASMTFSNTSKVLAKFGFDVAGSLVIGTGTSTDGVPDMFSINGSTKKITGYGDLAVSGSIETGTSDGAYVRIGNSRFLYDNSVSGLHLFSMSGGYGALRAGSVFANNVELTSSRSMKKDIQPFKNGLDLIKSIDVVSYLYKQDADDDDRKIGFIADDTDSWLSGKSKTKYNIGNTVGALIKAVQELEKKNHELEMRLLSTTNNKLRI